MLLPACLFWGDSRQGPARKIIKVSTTLMLCQGGEVCLFFQISKTLGSSLVLVPLLSHPRPRGGMQDLDGGVKDLTLWLWAELWGFWGASYPVIYSLSLLANQAAECKLQMHEPRCALWFFCLPQNPGSSS